MPYLQTVPHDWPSPRSPASGQPAPSFASGSPEASAARIEAEFLRLAPALFRYLYARTGRVQDAEDLLADVFVQAWRHRDRIEQPERWLFTVARNCGNRFLSRRRRDAGSSLDTEDLDATLGTRASAEWHDEAAGNRLTPFSPEMIALMALPESYREILVLHAVAGLPLDVVAQALAIGLPAARKHWELARRRYYNDLIAVGVHPSGSWRRLHHTPGGGRGDPAADGATGREEVADDAL